MSDTFHSSQRRSTRSLAIVAGFLAILLLGLFPIGLGALLVVHDGRSTAGIVVSAIAVSVLALVPLVAGAIVCGWIVDPRTPEGRVYFIRLLVVAAAAEVVAAVALGVASALDGLPGWLPIVIIAASAILTVVSIPLAESIRRRNILTERRNSSVVRLGRVDVRRKIRGVVLTFAITLVVSLVGGAVTVVLVRAGPESGLDLFVTLLSFPFLAASIACLVTAFPLAVQVRPLFGQNLGLQKKISQVVVKGQPIELQGDDALVATRYALLIAVYLPFQLAQSLLLFAALILIRVGSYANDARTGLLPFDMAFALLLVVVLAWVVPTLIVRIRRVRRYRDDNPELLAEPVDSTE